jgi:WD40 repeat protein
MYYYTQHTSYITRLYTINSEILASTAHDKTLKLWNIKTQQYIDTLESDDDEEFAFTDICVA